MYTTRVSVSRYRNGLTPTFSPTVFSFSKRASANTPRAIASSAKMCEESRRLKANRIPLLGTRSASAIARSLKEGGVAAPSTKISRRHLIRRGRGGSFKGIFLTNTTPSAPSKVASRHLLLDGAATPPLLRLRAAALALRALRRGLACSDLLPRKLSGAARLISFHPFRLANNATPSGTASADSLLSKASKKANTAHPMRRSANAIKPSSEKKHANKIDR